jgi:hypothetical protein
MMTNPDRRRMLQILLAAGLLPLGTAGNVLAEPDFIPNAGGAGPEHDFDFFLGSWKVSHRRLKVRLANNNDWEEFDGATECRPLLGGTANLNDSIVNRPGGSYRGLGLRAYDRKTSTWADWYLSTRNPSTIDIPGIGRFSNGVGTFLSDDRHDGKPIKVRGLWSRITPDSLQWEQAFSPDRGKTWETNWVMRYARIA